MRKVFLIALNALTQLARDRRALIMLLLMPMILIGILGMSLKEMMGDGRINPFPVVVVNADQPAKPQMPPGTPQAVLDAIKPIHLGQTLIDDVLGSDAAKEVLKVEIATDLEQARQAVLDGKYSAVIYVPPTFSADVIKGGKPQVHLYSDPGKATNATIVEQVLTAFTEMVTSGNLAARALGPDQGQAFLTGTGAGAAEKLPKVTITSLGTKPVKAMQYYAAAMAIMFMLMTAFTRAKEILKEREDGTLDRILVSPTGKATIVAGQILGNVAVLMAQFVILMFGTTFIYGVDWGPWVAALAIGLAFSVAAAGIGTATAGLVNDSRAADGAIGVVSNICGALSGAMFPLYNFPDSLKLVAKFVPNYWALQGTLDQMAGMGLNYLWVPVAVLGAIGFATGSLGAWRLATK